MKKERVVVDTNVLIDYPSVLKEFSTILMPPAILEELDKLKNDKYKGSKARKAIKALEQSDNIEYTSCDHYPIPYTWDDRNNDNRIIGCAKSNNCLVITNDINVINKARALRLKYENYYEKEYTGVYTTNDPSFFENINLLENQYLIYEDKEYVYRNGELKHLSLPPSNHVKGLNSYQRCALDLLFNKDVPIKIITGEAGSGKTFLSVNMGHYLTVEKRRYNKMVLVRNPIGSGEDIGFLPGSIEDKTNRFYSPIIENIGSSEVVQDMIDREQLEKEIPFNIKGLTFNKSYILVEEAEDLDLKTLKLIGTRIGKDSVIVFSGDYAQAESKFTRNNGLVKLIEATKGNPLVGIVVLPNNVRSSASKIFSNL